MGVCNCLSIVDNLMKFICSFISRWIDVQEPWEPLDDDGEEEPYDDSVSVLSTPKNYGLTCKKKVYE